MGRWRKGGGRWQARGALTAFLIRRILPSGGVMLIVTMITFALLRMIPGNVAVAVMGMNAYRDPGAIKVFDADYGFNLPWYGQYFLDYPVLLGLTVVGSLATVIGNLLADIAYA